MLTTRIAALLIACVCLAGCVGSGSPGMSKYLGTTFFDAKPHHDGPVGLPDYPGYGGGATYCGSLSTAEDQDASVCR